MLTKQGNIGYILIVILIILQVGSTPLYAQVFCGTPGWIADKMTGCQVWNRCPLLNQSIIWTGECVDGKAHGKGQQQWYQDDKLIQITSGEMMNGLSQGKIQIQFCQQNGKLQFVTSGEMMNGQSQGKELTQVYQNGEIQTVHLGEMMNGQQQGESWSSFYQTGQLINLTFTYWKNGLPTETYEYQIGDILNGISHGKIQVQPFYQNGELQSVILGEVVNGQWYGKVQRQAYQNGELTQVDFGEMMNGQWQGETLAYQYQTGQLINIVAGSWKNGQPDGKFAYSQPMSEAYLYQWYENGQLMRTSQSDVEQQPTQPPQPTTYLWQILFDAWTAQQQPTQPPQPTVQPTESYCDKVCSGRSGLFGNTEALAKNSCGCPDTPPGGCDKAELMYCETQCRLQAAMPPLTDSAPCIKRCRERTHCE